MTDRELLEWAAKAYWGDEIDDVCSISWLEDDQAIGYIHADNQDHNGLDRQFAWNPLIDDGQAFQLAVRLEITVSHHGATHVCETEFDGYLSDEVDTEGDGLAATRRAIVRAAAAIGRAVR